MQKSFGRFELDEPARALRLDGRDQALQPLVFDLLSYLVAHRERVVPKEELLDKLWADVVVTDGSLQRVVSMLRAVLREGGLPEAVQTFSRRGYRFCAELNESAPAASVARAPSTAPLAESSAEALELAGYTALFAALPDEAIVPLERAVVAYEERADREGAARAALALTNIKLEATEVPIAKGWHRRALGHLSELPECKQHGISEWLAARFALFGGELAECAERSLSTMAIGRRLNDPSVHCLGLVYYGHVLIAQGDVRHGLALHDEAGVMAIAGKVETWVAGIVFCSIIWAYLHLGDHHRASQWTDEFTRWCEREPAFAFSALCRLHRGEVLAHRGELAVAEQEVSRARLQLAHGSPFTEGDAWRVLGEIRLSRGELDAAEAAFREAHRLGWNPQPCMALLLVERGQPDAAIKQLERALAQPGWTDGQRARLILLVLARIAAMSGKLERARSALLEVDKLSDASITPASTAELARARAELLWAEGDVHGAEPLLRVAASEWLTSGAPVHAAFARLRLCEALLAIDDAVSAELELSAAESVFKEIGAEARLQTCRTLRKALSEPFKAP